MPALAMAAVTLTTAGCTKETKPAAGADTAGTASSFRAPVVGDVAPAFTVATLGSDSARVGGAVTQPVTLVNIWATWCGPCKAEFPELQSLHTTYAKRGLRLIAVSIDTDNDAAVKASAAAMRATFVIGRDPGDEVRGKFGAVGIPESWLVGSDGKLLWKHLGAIREGDPEVRAAIERALASVGTR
jgi:cytochrome c biogenesis protein CcmG, thiol:disulfide interchange protein DsbE